MARSDREFRRVLAQAERGMNAVFAPLAHDLGDLVLRSAGPDGKVPVEKLREVQAAAGRAVSAALLGPQNRPFDDAHQPLSRYATVIATGQLAMIDLALEQEAKVLDRYLPEDLAMELRARFLQGEAE